MQANALRKKQAWGETQNRPIDWNKIRKRTRGGWTDMF